MSDKEIVFPLSKEERNLSYEDKAIITGANRCINFNWGKLKETCDSKKGLKTCSLLKNKKCEEK